MTSMKDQVTERTNPWVKAVLWCVDDDSMSVVLQFNPSTVTLTRSPNVGSGEEIVTAEDGTDAQQANGTLNEESNWVKVGRQWRQAQTTAAPSAPEARPAKSSGNYGSLRSTGGVNDSLTMTVMFDTTESDSALKGLGVSPIYPDMFPAYSKSVLGDVEQLYNLTKPILAGFANASKPGVERPPVVVFLWDELKFSGAISAISVTVSAFDKLGVARRASVDLTILGRAYMQAKSGLEIVEDKTPVKVVRFSGKPLKLSGAYFDGTMNPKRRILFT